MDETIHRNVAAGVPEEFAADLATVDSRLRNGAEDRVTTTVADLTGRPPRSLPDFLRAVPEYCR